MGGLVSDRNAVHNSSKICQHLDLSWKFMMHKFQVLAVISVQISVICCDTVQSGT